MAPDIAAYTSVMEEIKRRTAVVISLHRKDTRLKFRAVELEAAVLQIRMILELVALASLAAHKSIFELHQRKFEAHWDPVKILKDVEKLNPHFYPRPVREVRSKIPGVVNDLVEIKDGFMTRDELMQGHGRCGNLLHARNPYGKGVDFGSYERAIPTWLNRVTKLLNCHQIHMLDEPERFYLVHMKEDIDDKVHMYTFQQVGTVPSGDEA